MTTVYFVRHGETDYANVPMRDVKATSPDLAPLTPLGRIQIETLARDYRLANVQAILTSSYARALESAAHLSRAVGAPLYVEVDLHEWIPPAMGLDGRVDESLLSTMTDVDAVGSRNGTGSGETLQDVRRRTLAVLARYRSFDRLAVVTHAVTIASIVGPRAVKHAEIIEYTVHGRDGCSTVEEAGDDVAELVQDDVDGISSASR